MTTSSDSLFPSEAEINHIGNLCSDGRANEALAAAEPLVRAYPNAPLLHALVGVACSALGKRSEAIQSFQRALALKPDYTEAYNNLGILHTQIGLPEAAAAYHRHALELKPDYADAHFNLGNALLEMGQHEVAAQSYRQAVQLHPEHVVAHCNLAIACRALGQHDEAITSYQRAINVRPAHAEAYFGFANTLMELGECHRAVAKFRKAIELKPDFTEVHHNLGMALMALRLFEDAIVCFRRAVEIDSKYANSHQSMALAYSIQRKHKDAAECFERALKLEPDNGDVLTYLIYELHQQCRWDNIPELRKKRDAALRNEIGTWPPFPLLAQSDDPSMQLKAATSYARNIANRYRKCRLFREGLTDSGKRIRVAYVSSDFHEHATAYLMARLFELHDRKNFEVIGVSLGPDDHSAMRQRLFSAFDHFVDGTDLTDEDLAQRIAVTQPDIAVDLKGYTGLSRPGIFCYRPAPIQVSYLGYPSTTGAPSIDYAIVDSVVAPSHDQSFFSERLIQLPGCYQVSDDTRPRPPAPPRHSCGLPENGFVFCAFNGHSKITPEMFEIWMRLLKAVPESILWFLDEGEVNRNNLIHSAIVASVDQKRLVFADYEPQETHLARLGCADLFLDTTPYCGHTTACDFLWMGVPLITIHGSTFAGRVASSLLHALGVPELISQTPIEYEKTALSLARNPLRLAAVRSKIKANQQASSVFKTDVFRRRLEATYIQLVAHAKKGRPPASFELQTNAMGEVEKLQYPL